jgi:hypothetical protein
MENKSYLPEEVILKMIERQVEQNDINLFI